MENDPDLLFDYAIFIAALVLLLILLYLIVRISNHLSKKLKVVLIDFGFGFIASAALFQNGFRILFHFIKSLFTIAQDLLSVNPKNDAGNIIGNFLSNEGLLQVLLMISFFFLVSYFSSLVRIKYQIGEKILKEEDEVFKKRDVLLKNIVTAAIVLSSIYLCISTLIAVSYFNDTSNSKNDMVAALKEEYKKYEEIDLESKEYYIQTITDISNLLEQDTLMSRPQDLKLYTQGVISNIEHQYDRLEQDKNLALNILEETNEKKLSNDYKLKYKNEIVSWYYDFRNEWRDYVFVDFNNYLKTTSQWSIQAENKNNPSYFLEQEILHYNYPLPKLKREEINVRGDVFNTVAGWLLKGLSYQFIIIAGLIGFGFLGAAVSTLIREHKEEKETELLLTDLLGVLVRGFTAALIIFLAVKGGLSVLVRDAVDLNAYALFFTCFASAVYSENAWEWAKGKLLSNLESLKKAEKEKAEDGNARKKPMDKKEAFSHIDSKLAERMDFLTKNKAASLFAIIDKKLGL